MRATMLMTLAVLVSCSGGENEQNVVEAVPASLGAGQWEIDHEVTSMAAAGKAGAAKASAGDKSSSSLCLAEADAATPPAALFIGEGKECEYRDSYVKNGRINATMKCKEAGSDDVTMATVEGNYTDTKLDASVIATRYLASGGDSETRIKVSGRKGGACSPEIASAEPKKA